ncbi:MAG TPA: sulfatase-like hydrolase/transferase [Chthoniobacteraceae bacterium]|nr:sulfatase-like hydrolase/transferase [Chthoniobacteraceae bacterium]
MISHPPNRRDFLKTVLAAAAGTQFLGLVTQKAKAALPSQMNLLMIITDQERPSMWIPPEWEATHLPNLTRLKNNGVTFTDAFCCSAMCTPSRATMFTGLYPSQHHSPWTLTEDFQQTPIEPQLDPSLPNLATCMLEAGYDVVYKGKWHLSHGVRSVDGEKIEDDLSRYGFEGWVGPDAGGDTRLENFGGGEANHDQHYIDQAKSFLQGRIQSPTGRPFVLIVSLVNPHDVLSYPGYPGVQPPDPENPPYYIQGGYDETWLEPTVPPIPLPPTVDEDLGNNLKPTAHGKIKVVMGAGLGLVNTAQKQREYLNFYFNLLKKIDGQIGELLSVFDTNGTAGTAMLNNTMIIRTSDHGEMGMCHGALRQKTFLAYEEAIRVPMTWSNPVLYPTAQTSDALVSHVDLLPTICSLFGVPNWQSYNFTGVDYSSIVLDPSIPSVQDYVLFTFDDIYAGGDAAQFEEGTISPPNCLQMIRTKDFKYVRYYDPAGEAPEQDEFYDLRLTGGDYNAVHNLPLEMTNLAAWAEFLRDEPVATPQQLLRRAELKQDLATLATTRLAPRPYAASVAPEDLKLVTKRWVDPENGPQAKVQLTFFSRLNTHYRLERSTDLVNWTDTGASAVGNGGMVLMSDDLNAEKAFYRIQWSEAVAPTP